MRYALRQLTKNPAYTAIAVLTLALGIGVNTTMFTILNAVLFTGSAAPEPNRMMALFRTSAQNQDGYFAPADYRDYAGQETSFAALSAYYQNNDNLAEPGQPAQRLSAITAQADFFKVFGIAPELGRVFTAADEMPGAPEVAILSDAFWRAHYAADPGLIGKTVRMNTHQVTIIGVMPDSFEDVEYWGHVDDWRPMAYDAGAWAVRNSAWLRAIGRLKPGVTPGQAAAEAAAVGGRLAKDFPQTDGGAGIRIEPWLEAHRQESSRRISWLCMGLAAFVLLIACANLANLQFARMTERVREHAVRIALGATRLALIRQLLLESLLLSLLGGAFGVLLALWGTRLVSRSIYITGVQGLDLPVDLRVLLFTLGASALTGFAVGIVPAWIASLTDVNTALKQGSRGTTGHRSRQIVRKVLIVGELALALTLLAGAGFFVRGMQRAATRDMGWRPEGLVTANLTLPYTPEYSTDKQMQHFIDTLNLKLHGLPGASDAAIATYLPIVGSWRNAGIRMNDRPAPVLGKEPVVYYNLVTPGFFSTIGASIVEGRALTQADRASGAHVAVVNQAMARELWPGKSPLGARIANVNDAKPDWLQVVGVVSDVHAAVEIFQQPVTPFTVYTPLAQSSQDYAHWLTLVVRSSAPPGDVAQALRVAVRDIDPGQPVYGVLTAREAMQQLTSGFDITSKMLAVFALIGLLLAAIGLYGVIANLVAQRTQEIGIRMALGAHPKDVLWLVLGQGVRLATAGTLLGLFGAWAVLQLLYATVPAIPGRDYLTLTGITVLLAGVALFASWVPSRRATRVNPIIALRTE